jgi:hypothetical protein
LVPINYRAKREKKKEKKELIFLQYEKRAEIVTPIRARGWRFLNKLERSEEILPFCYKSK